MKLIYGDFMKSDYEHRLILTFGSYKDLEKHNIELENGLRLVFYNEDENDDGIRDDLVVEGVVNYDEVNKRWVAEINWNEIKNISQLSLEEKSNLGIT